MLLSGLHDRRGRDRRGIGRLTVPRTADPRCIALAGRFYFWCAGCQPDCDNKVVLGQVTQYLARQPGRHKWALRLV